MRLEKVCVPGKVIGDRINYLKEGVQVKAMFYGEMIFSLELPQFLELMIVKTEEPKKKSMAANTSKMGVLETGAKLEVPPFIEVGDIVKIDTTLEEYIQRI